MLTYVYIYLHHDWDHRHHYRLKNIKVSNLTEVLDIITTHLIHKRTTNKKRLNVQNENPAMVLFFKHGKSWCHWKAILQCTCALSIRSIGLQVLLYVHHTECNDIIWYLDFVITGDYLHVIPHDIFLCIKPQISFAICIVISTTLLIMKSPIISLHFSSLPLWLQMESFQ